ncbi:hypothetical protein [Pedobacter sp.]
MRKIIIFLSILGLVGCGKSKTEPELLPPAKAKLVFPAKDEACLSGKSVSDRQNTIDFSWEKADHTDSYELVVKNLLTNKTVSFDVLDNAKTATLEKSTPYAWYVVSKNTKSDIKAVSDTWKFYNSGPGESNYIPYPAEAVAPKMGETVTPTNNLVTLQWTALDLDNDIKSYRLYFGTQPDPALYKDNFTDNISKDIPVNSNTVYYWKVVTIDWKGNSSESAVYKFSVR